MLIGEMHVMFRQFAQQMGLQNVRAVLPEQIDLLINVSIDDTINDIIRTNIGITNDRVISDNSKIGQINDLKGLYTVDEFNCINAHPKYDLKTTYNVPIVNNGTLEREVKYNIPTLIQYCGNRKWTYDEIFYSDRYDVNDNDDNPRNILINPNTGSNTNSYFMITTGSNAGIYTCISANPQSVYDVYESATSNEINKIGAKICEIPAGNYEDGIFTHKKSNDFNGRLLGKAPIDPLFFVDFSLNYIKGTGDLSDCVQFDKDNGFTTNYFPVRLIDSSYLSDTLNDFILKNRLRSPVMVIYNNSGNTLFDLYTDRVTNGLLPEQLIPKNLKVEYIAKPAKVKYGEDIAADNVDCNLPEHLHVQIVKHAVDLYHTALTGDLSARQQANQQQNQENVRNQAQPYNQQQGGQQQ